MLTRDDLLSPAALKRKRVKLRRGEVFVREMTGAERENYFNELLSGSDEIKMVPGVQARLVCMCTVDENMNQVFNDDDTDAINRAMSGAMIQEIVLAILALSAVTETDAEDIE